MGAPGGAGQAGRGARPVRGLPWSEGLEPEWPLSRRGFCHRAGRGEHTCAVACDATDPAGPQAWGPPGAVLCDYLLMSCLSPFVSQQLPARRVTGSEAPWGRMDGMGSPSVQT